MRALRFGALTAASRMPDQGSMTVRAAGTALATLGTHAHFPSTASRFMADAPPGQDRCVGRPAYNLTNKAHTGTESRKRKSCCQIV